jgi:hypothetical protein
METLKKNPNILDIDPTITPKMYKKAFGRVHEKKETSASGHGPLQSHPRKPQTHRSNVQNDVTSLETRNMPQQMFKGNRHDASK